MSRHSVTLSWGPVSCLEWTPAEPRATVVLLHGGGVDSAELSWGGLGPELARKGFRVLAPDHPGYGESPAAPWPSTQQHLVDYVGEFVDALGLRRYAIGGLSLGGGMALGHVLQQPEKISGALLFASYGLMPRLSDGRWSALRQAFTYLTIRTGALGAVTRWAARSQGLMAATMKALIRDPAQRTPELTDEVLRAARQGTGLAAFAQWQREQVGCRGLATDYTDRLADIRCPVLVVHGTEDTSVPVAHAREAARRLPDATLVELPAGHWVQRDHPERVLTAVTEFLNRLA
jgi:pimeloyl-ACP methyl ester carboxylesterase